MNLWKTNQLDINNIAHAVRRDRRALARRGQAQFTLNTFPNYIVMLNTAHAGA